MIVDVCSLRFPWCLVPGHANRERANGLANILDLTIAYEGIKDVLLRGVTSQLALEPVVLECPMACRHEADLEQSVHEAHSGVVIPCKSNACIACQMPNQPD